MKRSATEQVVLHHNVSNDLQYVDTLMTFFQDAISRNSPDYLYDLVRLPNLLEILEKTPKGHYLYLKLKHHTLPEIRFYVAIYSQTLSDIHSLVKAVPKEFLMKNLVFLMDSLDKKALRQVLEYNVDLFVDIVTELAETNYSFMGRIYKCIIASKALNYLDTLLTRSKLHLHAQNASLFLSLEQIANDDVSELIYKHLREFADEEIEKVLKVEAFQHIFIVLIRSNSINFMKRLAKSWDDVFAIEDCLFLQLLGQYASHNDIKALIFLLDGDIREEEYTPVFQSGGRTFLPMLGDMEALQAAFNANNLLTLCWLQEMISEESTRDFYRWIFQTIPIAQQKQFLNNMASLDMGILTEGCDYELDKNLFRFGSQAILNYHLEKVADFSGFSASFPDAISMMPACNLKLFYDHEKIQTFSEDDEINPLQSAEEGGRLDLVHILFEHPNHECSVDDLIRAAFGHDVIGVRILLDRLAAQTDTFDITMKIIPAIENEWAYRIDQLTLETGNARNEIRQLLHLHLHYVSNHLEVEDPVYGTFKNAIQIALAFQTLNQCDVYLQIIFTIFPCLAPIMDKKLKLHAIVQCLKKKAKKDDLLQYLCETMENVRILRVLRLLVQYEENEEFLQNIEDLDLKDKIFRIYY